MNSKQGSLEDREHWERGKIEAIIDMDLNRANMLTIRCFLVIGGIRAPTGLQ